MGRVMMTAGKAELSKSTSCSRRHLYRWRWHRPPVVCRMGDRKAAVPLPASTEGEGNALLFFKEERRDIKLDVAAHALKSVTAVSPGNQSPPPPTPLPLPRAVRLVGSGSGPRKEQGEWPTHRLGIWLYAPRGTTLVVPVRPPKYLSPLSLRIEVRADSGHCR